MAKKIHFDSIVVVDIEATCWEKGKQPKDERSEIIEIGLCSLNIKTLESSEKTQLFIKPIQSNVSEFCTDLTGLTQAKLDKEGIAFVEACKIMQEKFNTKKRVWASYGDYDKTMFQNQCKDFGVDYPFNRRHINVKTYLPIVFGLTKELGMDKGLNVVGLPLIGVHHCGADDAWNISRILSELIRGGAAYTT